MCGIAGIYNFDEKPVYRQELKAMTDAIAHRGPDGEGFFLDGQLGLGHRRLAILDLSYAGKQPMSYGCERYWITYNGEIYNFPEIKHDLEAKGWTFRSETDTEIVLAAYVRWGADCLSHFNGMWAFAIWDSHEKILFLARDRFGIKPLFFFCSPKQFVFCSEIKGLLQLEGAPKTPNPHAIRDILRWRSPEDGIETPFKGIYRLKAGCWARVSIHGMESEVSWWDIWNNRVDVPNSYIEQVEKYRDIFDDAVRIRLRSDVPVGSLLSGGLDSSSIVCTISKHCNDPKWIDASERLTTDWQRTFTARFPGTSADEGEYPNIVLKQTRLEGTIIRPSVEEVSSFIKQMIEQQDEPIDQSLYAIHNVYRAVSQKDIKVTLDGQGADETLSGYEATNAARYYLKHLNLKEFFNASRCQSDLTPSSGSTFDVIKRLLYSELRSNIRLRTRILSLLGEKEISRNDPEWGAPSAMLQALPERKENWFPPSDVNSLDRELYYQVYHRPLPRILRKFDHASMAYSVESRMPFMDWRLICYSLSLPAKQKVSNGYTKYILRNAMIGTVPSSVLTRKSKLGFPIPIEWLSDNNFGSWVDTIVYDPRFDRIGYWNGPKFRKWLLRKRDTGWTAIDLHKIFSVITCFLWYVQYWH